MYCVAYEVFVIFIGILYLTKFKLIFVCFLDGLTEGFYLLSDVEKQETPLIQKK